MTISRAAQLRGLAASRARNRLVHICRDEYNKLYAEELLVLGLAPRGMTRTQALEARIRQLEAQLQMSAIPDIIVPTARPNDERTQV